MRVTRTVQQVFGILHRAGDQSAPLSLEDLQDQLNISFFFEITYYIFNFVVANNRDKITNVSANSKHIQN